jgi:hypothetical protein
VYATVQRAISGDSSFTLKRVGDVWLVRLPRFWTSSNAEHAELEKLVADVSAKAPELREATVVLDVRGNGGGDSIWGYRIAVALWGQDWVDRIAASIDGTHDWRASPANIAKVETIAQNAKGTEAEPYWTQALALMRAAQRAHKPLARFDMTPTPPTGPPPKDPIRGRVFLLVDSACGSSCLDFADLLLRLPHVTMIGKSTFADAVYIDNNEAVLPSGLGTLSYGMKVYRHRVRKNNEWYDPKYAWPGGPMTDDAIARWVKTLPRE